MKKEMTTQVQLTVSHRIGEETEEKCPGHPASKIGYVPLDRSIEVHLVKVRTLSPPQVRLEVFSVAGNRTYHMVCHRTLRTGCKSTRCMLVIRWILLHRLQDREYIHSRTALSLPQLTLSASGLLG